MDKPAGCHPCSLFELSKGFCPSDPKPTIDWPGIKLFVQGEAPGRTEIAMSQPFCGKAGWWMTHNILGAAGIAREEVVFDNTLRCLPPRNKAGNHYPIGDVLKDAESKCRQYDLQVPPGVPILCVGGNAVRQRLGLSPITEWQGHVAYGPLPIMVGQPIPETSPMQAFGCTYHPSAVMRQPNLLPLVVRHIYNILQAQRNPAVLRHPEVTRTKTPALDIPHWGNGPLAFDLEWDIKTRKLICGGVARNAQHAWSTYIIEPLAEMLRNKVRYGEALIGHNIIDADLPVLGAVPSSFDPEDIFDTQIASHLVHAHFASLGLFDLRSMVSYYRPTTNWKVGMKEDMLEYNGRDCAYDYGLYQSLSADLAATKQWHLMEKQQRLAHLAMRMQSRGIALDVARIGDFHKRQAKEKLRIKGVKGTKKVAAIPGIMPFNPDSPKQIIAHFAALKIKLSNTGAAMIEKKRHLHPDLEALHQYKEAGVKVITTWFPLDTARIHPRFNVTGTDVDRFSSSDPNAQNIPPHLRCMIVASPGMMLVAIDYSQLENRCVAWQAKDEKMLADFASGLDFHTLSGSRIHNKRMGDVTEAERYEGKRVTHATIYLETIPHLAEGVFGGKTKEAVEKATKLQAAFYNSYPRIKEWQGEVSAQLETGEVTLRNPFGRLRFIYGQDKHKRAKMGVHYLGCSTGADITNQRALDIDSELGMLPILIEHDELVWEVPMEDAEEFALKAKCVMEQPVPEMDGQRFITKVKIGPNYGELKELQL